MKPNLTWTPQAEEDLIDLYITIALDNERAAEKVYTEIERRVLSLRDQPRMGVRRPDIAEPARVLVHGVYLIFYETHPDTDDGPVDEVEIVRVVHGHRDLSRIY